ncbi:MULTISPECIES: hypothetical protein [Flavobacterium]|uniref:YtxH domain-containing protein n=2 Tax=Flavobacterium TaxID=237 RepID=A0A0A2LWJ0_9FLAO|nr:MULTISPECIES: hypothetical protein [Flavobacterium]KGO83598.1 hypothetical protein Q763_03270 [Flavobacterium beibuense F44-8]MUV02518.1 hypothetical protein [Flavobacterium rakeshii]
MSNKKLVLGIAAGVAALAVVGVICKRKGYLDGACEKAESLGKDLKDKYNNVKDSARKKFDEVVHKGGEIADRLKHKSETAAKNIDPATN